LKALQWYEKLAGHNIQHHTHVVVGSVTVVEWVSTNDHNVKANTGRPDIRERTVIPRFRTLQDFRSDVGRGSDAGERVGLSTQVLGITEVDDLNPWVRRRRERGWLFEHDIFELEIAMADALLVTVDETGHKLLEDRTGFGFSELTALRHVIEEIPTPYVLHLDAQMTWREKHLMELDDVGVIKFMVVQELSTRMSV